MAIRIPIITDFKNGDLKKAEREIARFADQATSQLKMMGIGAAVATGYAIKTFADFDDKMTQSLAIMGDVSEDLRKEMEMTAREVAKSTTFSAAQAAESYFFLASAGLDAAASISAMPQVASFAQAGMFDMARATDLLTDAQSALGLTVRDDAQANLLNMARVSDTLVKANTLANASVEQFSTALTTKAGPAMRAVGMDVEEGVAVLAAFADQGIKSELAGTNFAIVLRDLQTKAIGNKDAFSELGVTVFDSSGEMVNMADIVADLEVATAGMSDEQKKATFQMLGFADKSMGALAALLGTSDAIRGYESELRKANGTTQEIADKQLVSFTSQLKLLFSQIQDVAIEVGSQLVPELQKMVQYLNTDEGRKKMQQLADTLADVAVAAAGVVGFLADNITKLDDILIAVGAVRIAWGVLVAAVAIYNSATLGAVAVTNALKLAIASTGIGLAIIALGTLVAGMIAAGDSASDAVPPTDDYRLKLLELENQAKNTQGALDGMTAAGFIPASPTNDVGTRPLNPKPGEVYTYYNYSDRDNPNQAVWWQVTWTGTEWTKPKKMTYAPPSSGGGGGGRSAAQILSDNRAKLLSDIQGYNEDVIRLTRIGDAAMSSYEQTVSETFTKVRETISEAVDLDVITSRGGSALNRLASVTEGALTRIAKLRADLSDQYQELTQRLSDARGVREATREQISALADLDELAKSVTSTVDSTGKTIEVTGYSAATLITNLRGVVEGVKTFRDNMEELRELGLDPQLYQQIIESGMIAGGATAKAIIDGGPEAVSEINKLFGELETVGEDLGLGLSEVMYNGGEAAIEQLIAGVISMDNALATQAELIGETFFDAFQAKVNDSQFDTKPFLDKLRGMASEVDEIAGLLGGDFRDAFLAAIGDLTLDMNKPLSGLPTQQELTDYLPPVTVIDKTGKAVTAVFDEFGTLIRSFTGSAADIGESGLVNEEYFRDYVPMSGGGGNQTTINLTVNANDRIGGVKAGELAVEYISRYVDANGSVIKVFGG